MNRSLFLPTLLIFSCACKKEPVQEPQSTEDVLAKRLKNLEIYAKSVREGRTEYLDKIFSNMMNEIRRDPNVSDERQIQILVDFAEKLPEASGRIALDLSAYKTPEFGKFVEKYHEHITAEWWGWISHALIFSSLEFEDFRRDPALVRAFWRGLDSKDEKTRWSTCTTPRCRPSRAR